MLAIDPAGTPAPSPPPSTPSPLQTPYVCSLRTRRTKCRWPPPRSLSTPSTLRLPHPLRLLPPHCSFPFRQLHRLHRPPLHHRHPLYSSSTMSASGSLSPSVCTLSSQHHRPPHSKNAGSYLLPEWNWIRRVAAALGAFFVPLALFRSIAPIAALASFDPTQRLWKTLQVAPSARRNEFPFSCLCMAHMLKRLNHLWLRALQSSCFSPDLPYTTGQKPKEPRFHPLVGSRASSHTELVPPESFLGAGKLHSFAAFDGAEEGSDADACAPLSSHSEYFSFLSDASAFLYLGEAKRVNLRGSSLHPVLIVPILIFIYAASCVAAPQPPDAPFFFSLERFELVPAPPLLSQSLAHHQQNRSKGLCGK